MFWHISVVDTKREGGGAVAPMPKFQKALNDIKCVMKLYESIKAIMVGYVTIKLYIAWD